MAGLSQINIPSLKKLYSGKVRDTFAVGDDKLLIVASDRISAFDVILGDPIPGKGKGAHLSHRLLVQAARRRLPEPPHRH